MLPAPEYEYAGQSLHVDADVAAEAVPYFPAEHSVHAADPFTSLKLPAVHAVHLLVSAPWYPVEFGD